MDTRLLAAILTGVAVLFGLVALFPGKAGDQPGIAESVRGWRARRLAGAAELIAKARLELAPRTLITITIAGPLVLGMLGWLLSPLVALVGLVVGLLLPRAYLDYLVRKPRYRPGAKRDDQIPRMQVYTDFFCRLVDIADIRRIFMPKFLNILSQYLARYSFDGLFARGVDIKDIEDVRIIER